jgi:hypothetical protein
MGEYHTTERVLSFLRELERAGLNTWQSSWSERLETDWLKYKDQGGKLQLLLLSRPNFNDQPEMLPRAMKLKPMGIAQHGVSTSWARLAGSGCRHPRCYRLCGRRVVRREPRLRPGTSHSPPAR